MKRENVNIRKALQTDIIEIMYLMRKSTEAMRKQGIYEWSAAFPDQARIEKEMEAEVLYVAEYNHMCVAAITFSDNFIPSYKEAKLEGREGDSLIITRLVVYPTWQSKGLGSMMITFAEEYASKHNLKSVILDVWKNNTNIGKFIEKMGYDNKGDIFYPVQKIPFSCFEKKVN